MSLPPDWATLKQPAPQNHGTPAIDALRPGQPLRALLGDFLSDAAIARAEVGRETYGSLLTPHNGRDQAVDALQELADAAVYLAAAWMESESASERWMFSAALIRLGNVVPALKLAVESSAKRLDAAAKQESEAQP